VPQNWKLQGLNLVICCICIWPGCRLEPEFLRCAFLLRSFTNFTSTSIPRSSRAHQSRSSVEVSCGYCFSISSEVQTYTSPNMSETRLCEICHALLGGSSPPSTEASHGRMSFQHRTTAESFLHALQMGCEICKRLCAGFPRDSRIETDKIADWRSLNYHIDDHLGSYLIVFSFGDEFWTEASTALTIQPCKGPFRKLFLERQSDLLSRVARRDWE
jgi:hypothetical protein